MPGSTGRWCAMSIGSFSGRAPPKDAASEGFGRRRPDVPLPHLRGRNGHGQDPRRPEVIERSGVDLVVLDRPEDQPARTSSASSASGTSPSTASNVEFFTYEGLVRVMDEWNGPQPLPPVVLRRIEPLQERHVATLASLPDACGPDPRQVRPGTGLRDRDVRHAVAEDARATGGVSARSPGPASCGRAARRRWKSGMAFMVQQQFDEGTFKKRIGWKDDEQKVRRLRRDPRGGAARIGRHHGP